MFRKYRGMRMTYEKQGLIFFLCRNFGSLPPGVRRRIERVSEEVAGEEKAVLLALLTGRQSARHLSMTRYINLNRLYAWRRAFYESFFEQKEKNPERAMMNEE